MEEQKKKRGRQKAENSPGRVQHSRKAKKPKTTDEDSAVGQVGGDVGQVGGDVDYVYTKYHTRLAMRRMNKFSTKLMLPNVGKNTQQVYRNACSKAFKAFFGKVNEHSMKWNLLKNKKSDDGRRDYIAFLRKMESTYPEEWQEANCPIVEDYVKKHVDRNWDGVDVKKKKKIKEIGKKHSIINARRHGDTESVLSQISHIEGVHKCQGFLVEQIPWSLLEGLLLEFGSLSYQKYFETHSYGVAVSDVDSMMSEKVHTKCRTVGVSDKKKDEAMKRFHDNTEWVDRVSARHLKEEREEMVMDPDAAQISEDDEEFLSKLLQPIARTHAKRNALPLARRGVKKLKEVKQGAQETTGKGNMSDDSNEEGMVGETGSGPEEQLGNAWLEASDIVPYWRTNQKTRFMASSEMAMECKQTVRQKPDPSQTIQKLWLNGERVPFDSAYHTEAGVARMELLESLLEDCLAKQLSDCPGNTLEEEEEEEEKEEADQKDKDLEFLHEFLRGMELNPGMLKTGCREVHQELHLDEIDLMQDKEAMTIMAQVASGEADKLTAFDWLKAGYVVDIPLSYEGACYRIGVMNANEGKIEMKIVHVPFGGMLVRSNTLFHSGNYGSPGNSRFHGQFKMRTGGIESGGIKLGYARFLNKKYALAKLSKEGKGWRVVWSDKFKGEKTREPSMKRWTETGNNSELDKEDQKRMKELKGISNSNKNEIAQKWNDRCKHMHVALYMLNPEHKEKTKHNMSGRGKGAQDGRLVDLSKDSDSDDSGGGKSGGGNEDGKVRAKAGGAPKSKEKKKGGKDNKKGRKDKGAEEKIAGVEEKISGGEKEKISGGENEAATGLAGLAGLGWEGGEVPGGDQETAEPVSLKDIGWV